MIAGSVSRFLWLSYIRIKELAECYCGRSYRFLWLDNTYTCCFVLVCLLLFVNFWTKLCFIYSFVSKSSHSALETLVL